MDIERLKKSQLSGMPISETDMETVAEWVASDFREAGGVLPSETIPEDNGCVLAAARAVGEAFGSGKVSGRWGEGIPETRFAAQLLHYATGSQSASFVGAQTPEGDSPVELLASALLEIGRGVVIGALAKAFQCDEDDLDWIADVARDDETPSGLRPDELIADARAHLAPYRQNE